jgi:hypothetical protein
MKINVTTKDNAKARGVFSGVVGRLWYVGESLFSYGIAVLKSFLFIAFTGLFISLRGFFWKNKSIKQGQDETDDEDELMMTSSTEDLQSVEDFGNSTNSPTGRNGGRKKSINIYYASQTGTAKVSLSFFCT